MSKRNPQPVAPRRGKVPVAVKLSTKEYGVSADHNAGWWAIVQQYARRHGGVAAGPALVKAGVPSIFINYCVRRGWLTELARLPKPKAKAVKPVTPKGDAE